MIILITYTLAMIMSLLLKFIISKTIMVVETNTSWFRKCRSSIGILSGQLINSQAYQGSGHAEKCIFSLNTTCTDRTLKFA